MEYMRKNFQKFISIMLLVSFVISGFLLPLQYAKAFVPVTDPAHTAGTKGGWIAQAARWIEEKGLPLMRDVLAKKLIDIIVTQTIDWIQGGGKPLFVSNWKAFLKQASDVAFDTLIKDIGLAGLCAPFKFSMRVALLPVKKFPQRVECTLDKVVKNIQGFYNNFQEGNWAAFAASWQPQNNYYGQLVISNDELTARIASEQDAAAREAAAGSGFLSVKKCVQYDEDAIAGCKKAYGANDPVCNREKPSYCLKYETMTPGDSVGKAVAAAVTSDSQWAANIQSWSASLVNAVINKITTVGLAKIAPGLVGTDSYYPSDFDALRRADLDQQRQFYVDDVNKFISYWSAIRSAKEQTLEYAKQSIDTINAILATNCLTASETTKFTDTLNQYNADISGWNLPAGSAGPKGRLPSEIDVLGARIYEGTQVKNFILGAGDTSEDSIKVQQTYNTFSNKFGEDRTAKDSDSGLNSAKTETANFKVALDNQKKKLSQCQGSL